MCGRYVLTSPAQALAEAFGLSDPGALALRVNITPGTPIAVVRNAGGAGAAGSGMEAVGGARELAHVVWGLIPSWAKDPAIGQRMINARGESVAEKPSFRNAFRRRRCLVPANGFFEWPTTGPRQPYLIAPARGGLFAFAGLWEVWQGPNGEELETCAIVTAGAEGKLRRLHPRTPVILDEDSYAAWLDPRSEPESLQGLLRGWPDARLRIHPVSRAVNDPRNQGPGLLEPVEPEVRETAPAKAEPRQGSLF